MTRYAPSPAGTYGCRLCLVLRQLGTFVWRENVERMRKLWAEGECSAAMIGCAYTLVEAGDDYSLFQIDPREVGPELAKRIGAIWVKNESMHAIEEASP